MRSLASARDDKPWSVTWRSWRLGASKSPCPNLLTIGKFARAAKTFKHIVLRLTGEEPKPLMPEDQEKAIREIPREPEVIELFKKSVSAPVRFRRTAANSISPPRRGASGLTVFADGVTKFFSTHTKGQSVMFLIAREVGRAEAWTGNWSILGDGAVVHVIVIVPLRKSMLI